MIVREFLFYRFEKKGFYSDRGMSSERGAPCGTRGDFCYCAQVPPRSLASGPSETPPRTTPTVLWVDRVDGMGGSMDENFKFGFIGLFAVLLYGSLREGAPAERVREPA